MFVTSTPPQDGTWNWFSDTEVHYRSMQWWQPGTKLSVRLATGGLAVGNGGDGGGRLALDAPVRDKPGVRTANATHLMTVAADKQGVPAPPPHPRQPPKPAPH